MARAYLSAKREAEDKPVEPFTLDGVEFTPSGEVHLLDLCELARNADADIESPTGMGALADFFEGLLGTAEYRRFRAHCRAHHTSPDILFEIMNGVVEDLAGRPTQRSVPSAPGPSTTGNTAKVVSLQARTVLDIEPGQGDVPELPAEVLERIQKARAAAS